MNAIPTRTRRGRIAALVLLAAMFLAGCPTFDPVRDDVRFYTLDVPAAAQPPPPASAPATKTVGVRVTALASYLRQPGIVTRVSEHEVRYASDHRWAGRLDAALERALAAVLSRELAPDIRVLVAPPLREPLPAVLLEIDLEVCEGRVAEGAAVVQLNWRILSGDAGAISASGTSDATKSGWNGTDFDQLAALLGAGVDELGVALGPRVREAVDAASPDGAAQPNL